MHVEFLSFLLLLVCFSEGNQNCSDDCSKPLGLEDYSIKNSQISGGTSYNDDYANYGSQNARLHASSGYRADPSTVAPLNMIGIELGEDTVITGIATQGYGDPTVSEWVTNFNVFYKNSLGRYQPVRSNDGKALDFLGNTDSTSVKRSDFPIPVLASTVYILPLTANSNVGLRMELYGCKGGHYFVIWLMLRDTFFTVEYTNNSSYEYQDAIAMIMDEVNDVLGTTWGFLYAHIQQLSPQMSPSFSTLVTAITEIHCLRGSEQLLLAKLQSGTETEGTIFEPGYIKYQYPKRCGCPPPKAELRLGKTLKNATEVWFTPSVLRYSTNLQQSCPHKENKSYMYSWKVSKIDKETGLFGPFQEFSRRGEERSFILLMFLGLGYAYVQCIVETRGDAGSTTFDDGYLNIVHAPLKANITHITRSERSTRIKLSAEHSFDAGKKWNGPRGLQFTWFCKLEGEAFSVNSRDPVVDVAFGRNRSHSGCFGFGPGMLSSKDKVLVVNVTEMVKSKKYIFKLVVHKDVRNASTVYEFDVKPQVSIFIRWLSNCREKITPQQGLQLEAFCEGELCSKISQYKWSLFSHNNTPNDFSIREVPNIKIHPQEDSKRLFVNDIFKLRDDTNRHVSYTVEVTAKLEDEVAVAASFSFVVNSPPKRLTPNASCEVSPLEGEAISTDFLITCSGWHDVDRPLTYQFSYGDKYGMVLIQTGSSYNVSAKLPIGDSSEDYRLVLEAQVKDSFADFTKTQLFVKVRPPKRSDFNDELVVEQLNIIREFVKVGDADRATELASMLMSTAKSLDDENFDQKANAILHDIEGLKVKNVVHVTKVAAVVIGATENKESVPLLSQGYALTLLTEATNFMTSQLSSKTTHDTKLEQNVSSVLLNSIGSLMKVSSRDARLETKDNFKQAAGKEITLKVVELVNKVGEALSSISHIDGAKTVVKSRFMDIVIYKEKPENFGGQNISEQSTSVFIPDSARGKLPNSNDSLSLQIIAFKVNPYTWDTSASSIHSKVIDITLRTSQGVKIEISNFSKPIALQIPSTQRQEKSPSPTKQPHHLFLHPGVIQYHTLIIPSKEHLVSLRIATAEHRRLAVYFGRGFKPTATNYTSIASLPDFSSCKKSDISDRLSNCNADPNTVKHISNDSGLYYVGIRLMDAQDAPVARLRRSCTGTKRRSKRSCVEVKDPPTTPPPTPTIVTPKYNSRTDVNYTFSVTMGTCLYWSEKEEKWSRKGCKVGPKSLPGRVHCLCNHLTSFGGDFFVAPNPIDFDKVWAEFGRMGETGNYVVLATVCSMLAVYLVGLMFARRADKNDELKVIAGFRLSDQQCDRYTYSISIQTGTWRNSGTTANVGMVIYGVEEVSKPIIFASNNLQRIFFARGSVNTFTLTLEKSLGSLFKLNVWHDNSGDNPSWFLLKIDVEDIQTKEKWHFIANRWLAVDKGNGEIELESRAASEEEILEFKNVLHSRTQEAFGDSHLWVSLFTKPPQNQFTRCQRLSCCMSIIFCAMVTGAMFYRFGAKATDVFHIGPLKMSWTEIKIGIQSGLVVVPVNFLIVTIFKNTKQTGDQPSSTGCICLPHFFIYIGWGLCVSAMLPSAVFTVFYSLSWGAETSNQWLISMTFSLFEDVLLIQPIKVLFIVCVLSMVIRKPPDIDEVHASQVHLQGYLSAGTENGKREARILQMEELENARRQRKKELKAFRVLVEIIFFIVFIVLFTVVCYGNRDSARYGLTKSVQDVFKDFSKVDDVTSFWGWMKNTFVPGMYNTSWYNGFPFDHDEGFISNRENFLVGMPKMRQVRVLPEIPCGVQSRTERKLGIPRCLPFYSNDRQDTTPYNKPGWIPVNNVTLLPNNSAELESLCPKPWQYLTAHDLNTEPIRGIMAEYSGGGYVANLGYNSGSALRIIESLEQKHWIDDKTAAVLLECTVFEPSTSLFSVLKYLYERYPTGGVFASSNVKTITVYLPQGSNSYRIFYQVCQVLLTLVILIFAIVEIAKALRGARAYFLRFWSWVEIILICFAAAAIAVMLYKDKYTREYVRNVRANPFDNWSADQIVLWSEIEDYLLACVVFIVTIKFLRLIRFNRHIFHMRMTLRDSVTPLCSFSAVFVVILLAFASFGYMAFGSSIIEYSSLMQTIISLLQMLIGGKSSYYQLKVASESSLGPLFLFVYLVTAIALLINVFIAILDESYTTARENTTQDADDLDYAELVQHLWSWAKSVVSYMHGFRKFFRESFCFGRKRRKHQLNESRQNDHESERCIPRLASLDSLGEVLYPKASLEHADEMISEVLINLTRLFNDTVQGDEVNSERTPDSESGYSASELESDSECSSFLEGNLYHSSPPFFEINERFPFDKWPLGVADSIV